MSAPIEWRESFWNKLKKDKLFTPIDLSDKNNFKEIRIKIGKKFIVLAINIFLFSFSFNLIKDTFNICQAEYNILNVDKIDFSKKISKELIEDEQNKIAALQKYVKKKDLLNIAKTTTELSSYNKIKEYLVKDKKKNYLEENKNVIKGTILSFTNNLFILYLILKKKVTRQQ